MRLFTILIVVLVATGCEQKASSPQESGTSPSENSAVTTPTEVEQTQTDAEIVIGELDSLIATHAKRGAEKSSWIDWNTVARLHMKRARIVGNSNDHDEAAQALESAFALVDTPPAALLVTRARLAQTQHRFAAARADLEETTNRPFTQVGPHQQSKVLRGIVAYEAGDLGTAETLWNEALEIHESPAVLVLLANVYQHRGDRERATQAMDLAVVQARKGDEFDAAWILVQRGLHELDYGHVEKSLPFYQEADERFSGWYVVEEHLAEALAGTGNQERAAEIYESVVTRIPDPELMAAYASLLQDMGRNDEAQQWLDRAKEALEKAIAEDPAATSGHGIDLLIEWDPPKAVELGQLDFAARPGPTSAEQLAHAHVANNQYDEAWTLLESYIVETGWRSPRGHALVYVVATQRGDTALAEEHAALATELHPTIIAEFTGE